MASILVTLSAAVTLEAIMMQPLADESLAALERNASTAIVPGVGVPLCEVVARLPGQIRRHQVAALAGNLAFRLVLTILPGLLALTWLLRALHAEGAIGGLLEGAQLIVPGPAGEAVTEQVQNAPQKQAEGDLSFAAALSGLVALGSLILACRASSARSTSSTRSLTAGPPGADSSSASA